MTYCSAEYAETVRPDGSTELLPVSGGMINNGEGSSTSVSLSLSPSPPFLSVSVSLSLPFSFSLLLLGAKIPDGGSSHGDHQPWGRDQGELRVCGKATDKDVS